MASVLGESPYVERRTGERRRVAFSPMLRGAGVEGLRVSWGGVWGGVLVTMGMLLILGSLGVAIGASTIDPSRADPAKVMTAAGIWGAASLLVALFIGGMVSTRIGMVYDGATGLFEGMLVWIVTVILMGLFAGSGIGLMPDFSIDLDAGRTAAWMGLAAMLLSLIACIAGARAGCRGAAQRIGARLP
ncbi:MAG: hypothetical protein JO035_02285 [Betaproteobacteria bacterium]|nr:hypothetical protein [Betaproteobacteria bacterium]